MGRKKGCLSTVFGEEGADDDDDADEVGDGVPKRVSSFSHRIDCRKWRQSVLTSDGRSPQLHSIFSMLAGRDEMRWEE